jgi:hypothetical protein
MGGQLFETFPVNGVTTGHFVRGRPTAKEEFLTDGTVRLVLAILTVVVVIECLVNAHTTIVAVLKVLGTAHPAETTLRAVVGVILLGHPKVADRAMVLPKFGITINATVTVWFSKRNTTMCEKDLPFLDERAKPGMPSSCETYVLLD